MDPYTFCIRIQEFGLIWIQVYTVNFKIKNNFRENKILYKRKFFNDYKNKMSPEEIFTQLSLYSKL